MVLEMLTQRLGRTLTHRLAVLADDTRFVTMTMLCTARHQRCIIIIIINNRIWLKIFYYYLFIYYAEATAVLYRYLAPIILPLDTGLLPTSSYTDTFKRRVKTCVLHTPWSIETCHFVFDYNSQVSWSFLHFLIQWKKGMSIL